MNLNIKYKTQSLNRRRKIGPISRFILTSRSQKNTDHVLRRGGSWSKVCPTRVCKVILFYFSKHSSNFCKKINIFSRSKRLGSVPLLNKYTRHKSSSNGGSSIDLSTSIVPEDFELPNEAVSPHLEANMINMPLNETTSALFRKRYRYSTYFGIRVHV